MAIYRRDPPPANVGVECKGYEKVAIFTNISLYLRNDTRYGHIVPMEY